MSSTAVSQTYQLSELRSRNTGANHVGIQHRPNEEADEPSGTADSELHQYEVQKSFQLLKTSIWFVGPNQRLTVMPTGGVSPTPSPSYHTSSLVWPRGWYLPPSFSVYLGAMIPKKKSDDTRKAPCLGKVSYKGWEGAFTLHFVVELFRTTEDGNGTEAIKRFDVRRDGVGRTYRMGQKQKWNSSADVDSAFEDGLLWRSVNRKRINNMDIIHPDTHGHGVSTGTRIGHLELVKASEPNNVLALFKNEWGCGGTNHLRLGDFYLFKDFQEGEGLEEVLLAGMGLVAAERMSKRS